MAAKKKTPATRTAKSTKSRSSSSASKPSSSRASRSKVENIEEIITNLWSRPATKYVLGGVVASALIPVTLKALKSYPAIGEFLRENLDAVEEKLGEFSSLVQNGFSSDDETQVSSRH